ncbi:hypothetical protein FRZ67_03460 [Panacibacter ginsenosidivorans]|uniref:Beta-lactamase-inhibitor-like PepSY-like domain-containing protein n=1 Tax=Panacibacter ginsenosidivorans TaxID=1813871 RepID=A0A5B8V5B8_9BACT|nr:hypothetical protein [Panacibacter ginsenosidivorans]QEC66402.1 hypothetical protein FRZ67_03460 [Panacibacter ginsenosidivorans]
MKRIMLSAAAIILIVSAASAGGKKISFTTPASNMKLNLLSNQFKDLCATVPAKIEVKKNLTVFTDATNDENDETPSRYIVTLAGKGYDEKANYDSKGILISYEDKIKDAQLPAAVTDAIMQKHTGAIITKDREIIKDSKGITKDEYKVHFKDNKKHYTALVEANGTIDRMHKHFI